jgi:starch synthase (maltosyl-transferring)
MIRRNEDIVIEDVRPQLDNGRFPIKRLEGEVVRVSANIFKGGTDVLEACVVFRPCGSVEWIENPMKPLANDLWIGEFRVGVPGSYEYSVTAWVNPYLSWLKNIRRWLSVKEDVGADLLDGIKILEGARARASVAQAEKIRGAIEAVEQAEQQQVLEFLEDKELLEALRATQLRKAQVFYTKSLRLIVDRRIAGFASWYEMFPRSQGTVAGKSGTFEDCARRLGDLAAMGFDVVYLTPIHPIGVTNRRGRNNSPVAAEGDPGSPWAIGGVEGGHTSVHPDLGGIEGFKEFLSKAKSLGIEVALDLAFQCSPDHPYVKEHPEWFYHRQDGSIRYAENPPKRYPDVYPLNFDCEDWESLWNELKKVVLFWIDVGVKTFRVDNPHTKPFGFWEWLIEEVKSQHPDVVFLSEAFTKPKVMYYLSKLGFSQSYTYFTWKNYNWEIEQYFTELSNQEITEFFRPMLFTNTPDILPYVLQNGGRPAFEIRVILASTLSSLYGIYSGYELCENEAVAGKEEYLNSEKYEIKIRDWDKPGNIKPLIAKLNWIRKENPALQNFRNILFCEVNNPNIVFYCRWDDEIRNVIMVAVNVNPFQTHEAWVRVPVSKFGLNPDETYRVRDLLTDVTYFWKGERNYVRLDPWTQPAHILLLERS